MTVPLPKLRENDVLIKVKACGVCGTDLHIHEGEFLAKVRWESVLIYLQVVVVVVVRRSSKTLMAVGTTHENLDDQKLIQTMC